MTIERQWIEIMQMEVPDAFTREIPFHPEAGFIDAQIKLMSMPRECTWDTFLTKQFRDPMQNLWNMGAKTIVLAFDDYSLVPRAKAITQAKRKTGIEPIAFEEGEELPSEPPSPWNAAMANRAFKAKVVSWVQECVPRIIYDMPRNCSVVVDWKGPEQIRWTQGQEGLVRSEEPRFQVPSRGAAR